MGAKAGDEPLVKVTFPESYGADALAGKDAEFKCGIKEVRTTGSVSDEELLKQVNQENMDGLRSDVLKRLEGQASKDARQNVRAQINRALLESNMQDLPSQLVDQELDAMVERAKRDLANKGINPEDAGFDDAQWRAPMQGQAKDRVLLALVIGSIGRDAEIKPDDARIDGYLDSLTQGMPNPDQMKQWVRNDEKRMDEVQSIVMEEAVMDWIIDQADVTDSPCALADVGRLPGEAEDSEKASD